MGTRQVSSSRVGSRCGKVEAYIIRVSLKRSHRGIGHTCRCNSRKYYSQLRILGWLGVILFAVAAGCSESQSVLKCVPVSGKVLVDGRPPVRAEVRLRPALPLDDPMNRSIEPYAFVRADGTFTVGTYLSDDGAPEGEYALTLVWPTVTVEGGEEIFGADRFKGRFANPGAPITTIRVEDDEITIPDINLTTK